MHPSLITFLSLLTLSTALPLNINLGAYSPALVVGDGEISFAGGGEGATNIIDSLEGAAVSGAAGAASRPAARQVEEEAAVSVSAAAEGEQKAAPILNDPTASLPEPGDPRRSSLGPRSPSPAPDLAGFDRALKYAEAALTKGPAIQLGTEAAGVGIIVDNNAGTGGVNVPASNAGQRENPERGIVIVAPGPEREE